MSHRSIWTLLLVATLAAGGCSNNSESGGKTAEAPALFESLAIDPTLPVADQFAKLTENYDKLLESVEDIPGQTAIRREHTLAARQLVDEHPNDPDVAKVLVWIVMVNQRNAHASRAMNLIKEKYLDSPDIADVVGHPDLGPDVVNRLAESSPHDQIRGVANFVLASYAMRSQKFDEAKQKLNTIVDEFGDVPVRDTTLGDMALLAINSIDEQIEIMRIQAQLQIGKVVPDIIGKDTDGVEFKLSDYRGKVVMLDFWGNW